MKEVTDLTRIHMVDNSYEVEKEEPALPKSPSKGKQGTGTPKRKELRSVMQIDVKNIIKI